MRGILADRFLDSRKCLPTILSEEFRARYSNNECQDVPEEAIRGFRLILCFLPELVGSTPFSLAVQSTGRSELLFSLELLCQHSDTVFGLLRKRGRCPAIRIANDATMACKIRPFFYLNVYFISIQPVALCFI